MDIQSKKKKKPNDLQEFEEMKKQIQKVMEDLMVGVELPEEWFDSKKKRPFVMGFSLSMAPGGKINVNELNELKSKKRVVPKERTPLLEVIDFGEKIIIIGELPGAKKEDIAIRVRDKKVSIVVGGETPYYQEIELNASVKKRPKKSFKNGILEITLEKI